MFAKLQFDMLSRDFPESILVHVWYQMASSVGTRAVHEDSNPLASAERRITAVYPQPVNVQPESSRTHKQPIQIQVLLR
jgi:hypothetical protein